jgi:hypothetical protein
MLLFSVIYSCCPEINLDGASLVPRNRGTQRGTFGDPKRIQRGESDEKEEVGYFITPVSSVFLDP